MKRLTLVTLVLFLAGCATQSEKLARHGSVAGKPDGYLIATGTHTDQETAIKIAMASAEQCCLNRGKFHVIYDQKIEQEETLVDERVAQTADIISKAASVAGHFGVPGGNILRGKKYAEVTFKCE